MEKELVVESEETQEVVNEDVVLEQNELTEQLQSDEVAQADSKPEPEKTDEREHNFKELREKIKKTEKERDDLLAYFAQVTQEKKPEPPAEPDYSDDDLLEGRHLKKEMTALRKQMDEYKKQTHEQTVEMQLQAKYSDFNEVMSYDNICALRKADPDLADSLASNPNLKSKAMATYKQIKKLGIVADNTSLLQKERIQGNSGKPRSSNTVAKQSDSPLTKVGAFSNRLTPEMKAELYKDMLEKARGS